MVIVVSAGGTIICAVIGSNVGLCSINRIDFNEPRADSGSILLIFLRNKEHISYAFDIHIFGNIPTATSPAPELRGLFSEISAISR